MTNNYDSMLELRLTDHIYDRELNETEKPILSLVNKEYFSIEKSPIACKLLVEGQGLDEKRNFVIGAVAGPSCQIENLFHEMGHFAEREIEKLRKRPPFAWGYSFGKYWSVPAVGKCGYEPQTDQSVRREIRVWAYQYNIMKHYGMNPDVYDLVESAKWLDAWFLYHKEIKTEQFSGERPYKQKEDEKLRLAAEEVLELAETKFTFEKFNQAWNDRIEILKKQRLRKKLNENMQVQLAEVAF